ncbi:DUF6197 family protein [Streptomyces harbinensis]|uniref:DUF6197 family protein n=1 Tax=Streptomyces harbinensis TaxID=1176198 RepID=UPI0036CE9BF9
MSTDITVAGRQLVGEVEAWLAAQAPSGRPVELSPLARGRVAERAGQIAAVAAEDVLRVLAEATSVLIDRGWVRGEVERAEGMCLSGALRHVGRALEPVWGYQRAYDARRAAELAVEVVLAAGEHTPYIPMWNDDLRRQRHEVLAVLAVAQQVAVRIGGR